MFEYKTRTETVNGCKFIQQDILLLDYLYHSNSEIECVVDYMIPGFGFVIVEDNNDNASTSENVYIIKFGKRNQYQIINREYNEQSIVRDEFILGGKDINPNTQDLRLVFKFTDNDTVRIYAADKNEYGINIETLLIEYRMPYEILNYKLGFYSNGGNTLKFAAIKTDAPSNWISNVFNGNGGRINWITNGFEIEDCEYDCEVESQGIELDPGTYYFDFKTTNPDIKYYIYPAEQKDIETKRPLDEILATKEDEVKNILNYEDGSFEVQENQKINIKFKGKWRRVTEIAVKQHKLDDFVETDYDSIKREASYIEFDLSKISKIEIEGTVNAIPDTELTETRRYNLFLCGSTSIGLEDINIQLGQTVNYVFNTEDRILSVITDKTKNFDVLSDTTDNILRVFHNVDAVITKLIVTTITGDEIDILLQKTFKVTVSKNIKTPIIVTDLNDKPLDLSGSYREVIEESRIIDLFNKYNIIKLSKRLCLTGHNIRVAGLNDGIVDTSKNTIEELGPDYTLISPNNYLVDYDNNTIKISQNIRDQYKYLAIEYNHCDNYRYEFTNYEREYYNLTEEQNLYVENDICDVTGAVILYGIPKGRKFYPELIYRIPNIRAINSIDYSAEIYETLLSDSYTIIGNRINLNDGVRERYDYLVIDYLKDNSYSINERENYYEVDIATTEDTCRIYYDSNESGVTNTYKQLNLTNMIQDNFIVLRKE